MKLQTVFKSATLLVAGLCASATFGAPSGDQRLMVHEWGTFTSLQDERGNAIGGINTDDEPVPAFVHNLHGELIQTASQVPPIYFKGWPRCDQEVVVRLETPVIYFHLPQGSPPVHLDVDVQFKGGWLTQFYPDAKASAPGLHDETIKHGTLTSATVGSLAWHNLTVGTNGTGPKTSERVWTAPREVDAANVTTAAGESERYLFYRGVGHLKAPLTISRDATSDQLQIRADWTHWVKADPRFTVGPLWLVDVRQDGRCAVRTIDPISMQRNGNEPLAKIPASFSADDYRPDSLSRIRHELRAALVAQGLYGDEADGLLNTWEVSYFKRPGTRLFFMVPPVWTEQYLPLRVSQSAYVTRAMVGRIELVTPHQRQLISKIAQGPASSPQWLFDMLKQMSATRQNMYEESFYQQAFNGKVTLSGTQIPADYRAYLDMGRFRNALILDELKRHPTEALQQFVKNYQLNSDG